MSTSFRVSAASVFVLPCALLGSLLATPVCVASVITDVTSDGTWCWFSDPRAFVDDDKVVAGWVTSKGSVCVGSYDLESGTTARFTLAANYEPDDHDYPAFLRTADGRYTAFFSKHSHGPYNEYRTTVNPGDISAWSRRTSLGTNVGGSKGAAYSNPYLIPGQTDKAYLFWRGANFNPTFSTGTYNPTTATWKWSTARTLITNRGQRPYVKYESNEVDRVCFAFTDGHPDSVRNNIYFAAIGNDSEGKPAYFRADGTKIKNLSAGALRPSEAEKVFNKTATGGPQDNSWIWDVAYDPQGRPVIAYSVFVNNITKKAAYHWARWTGSAWEDHTLVPDAGGSIAAPNAGQPYYSGGIALDHTNPGIVYCSRKVGAHWELEQWKTTDDGANWSSLKITTNSTQNNIRPVVPLDRPSDKEMVMWLSGKYFDYANPGARLYHQRTSSRLNYKTTVDLWIGDDTAQAVAAVGEGTASLAQSIDAATSAESATGAVIGNDQNVRVSGTGGSTGTLSLVRSAALGQSNTLVLSSDTVITSETLAISDAGLLPTTEGQLVSGSELAIFNGGAASAAAGTPMAPVPEPGTMALLAGGVIGLLGYACRRRRRAV